MALKSAWTFFTLASSAWSSTLGATILTNKPIMTSTTIISIRLNPNCLAANRFELLNCVISCSVTFTMFSISVILISLYKQSIRQKEIDKSILEDALTISKSLFYIKGIGVCYDRKGLNARYEQDYNSSITNHKRALSYLNQTSDTLLIIKCLNNLGVTYRKVNLEKEAFNYYFRALKLSEKKFLN